MYKQICDAYILGYKEATENANTDTTKLDDRTRNLITKKCLINYQKLKGMLMIKL